MEEFQQDTNSNWLFEITPNNFSPNFGGLAM
jgi:hypothetical protein